MKLPIEYVAGLVDADGSFNLQVSETSGPSVLAVRFVVNFRSVTEGICESVQETLGVGKVYLAKTGKGLPIWSWQTVKLADGLRAAELLLPHLHIKGDICRRFSEVLGEWIKHSVPMGGKRHRGSVTKPRWLLLKALDTMLTLNPGQQTATYWGRRKAKIDRYRRLVNKREKR